MLHIYDFLSKHNLQTLQSIDFTKIYQLKSLEFKNKGHMNFYEFCDLMKNISKYHISSTSGVQVLLTVKNTPKTRFSESQFSEILNLMNKLQLSFSSSTLYSDSI